MVHPTYRSAHESAQVGELIHACGKSPRGNSQDAYPESRNVFADFDPGVTMEALYDEGVVISFDQRSEYETLKEEAEGDRRRQELAPPTPTPPSGCRSRR